MYGYWIRQQTIRVVHILAYYHNNYIQNPDALIGFLTKTSGIKKARILRCEPRVKGPRVSAKPLSLNHLFAETEDELVVQAPLVAGSPPIREEP